MNNHCFTATVLATWLMTLGACVTSARALTPAGDEEELAQRQARLKAMQARGAEASLTIFPVVFPGEARKDAAEALALLLEKAGMRNLDAADAEFRPPEEAVFDEAPALFGEFIRAHPIDTDWALYAEFVGDSRPPRVDEIRAVVVDRQGACVWVDQQTPEDADFKRLKPSCPLTCCILVSERLRGQLGLTEADRDDSDEGPWAKRWAHKSGHPDKSELAAIERRVEVMKSAGPSVSVLLYPVQISGKADQVSATHLTRLLNDGALCQAVAAESGPTFKLSPGPNEQRRLWDLARAARKHVRANQPRADYALFAEYLISRRDETKVGAVHFVICDRAGEWVIVDFQNDHHGDFQSVDPRSREDCGVLLAKRLGGYLR
jgi:hypothetical protein